MPTMHDELAALIKAAEAFKGRTDLSESEASEAIELAGKINEMSARVRKADEAADALNQIFAANGVHAKSATEAEVKGRTAGELFVKSGVMRNHRKEYPHGIGEETAAVRGIKVDVSGVKAATSLINTGAGGGPGQRFDPYIYMPAAGRPTILDLVTRGTASSESLHYRAFVSQTPGAKVVPEAQDFTSDAYRKPRSAFEFKPMTATVATYADGVDMTTQEWKDDGNVRAVIDAQLMRNLDAAKENMILNGSGQGAEPLGILNAPGLQEQDFDTDILTTVRKARTKIDTAGFTPTALVVSALDAEAIDLLQATNGTYYGGGPVAPGITPSLWGVPIVVSNKVEQGTALMGDWASIHLLQVEGPNIRVFDQHKDYAEFNGLYLRAEERALQVLRAPGAFVKVALGN